MGKNYFNILFLNGTKENAFGGVERWMINLGKGLKRRGHKVYFAGRKNSIFLNICREENLPHLEVKFGIDYSIINSYKLSKILKSLQIDVIINHYNKDLKLAALAISFAGRNIINIIRAGLPGHIKNKKRYKFIYNKVADGIIAPSKDIKNRLISYGWIKDGFVRVIRNGILIPDLKTINSQELKQTLNIPLRSKIVGSFGRLVEQKQFDIFLLVAKMIAEEIPNSRFLIVGKGPLENQISNLSKELGINDKVILTGFQKNPTPFYSICDIVIMTSKNEGYPNVLLEAMALGKPVIAFDVGGIKEFIKNGENGFIIKPFDYKEMARICIKLLQNNEELKKIGNKAKEYVQINNSIDLMIDKTEKYLFFVYHRKFSLNE